MASDTGSRAATRSWLTGAVAGLVSAVVTGVIILLAFNSAIVTSAIPSVVGLSGLVAGFAVLIVIGLVVGLVYAAVATIDPLSTWAAMPNSGAALGLGFGIVLWVLAIVLVPLFVGGSIGAYAVSLRGLLAYALLGLVLGLGYGVAPDTRP